jgi:hypothetical protein
VSIPLDDARLRPHLRNGGRPERKAVVVASSESEVATSGLPGVAGGDARTLRGIPAVSPYGVGSAIPGTDPMRALLAKERRSKR